MSVFDTVPAEKQILNTGLFPLPYVQSDFGDVAASALAAGTLQQPVGRQDIMRDTLFTERDNLVQQRFGQKPVDLTGVAKNYPNPSADGFVQMAQDSNDALDKMITEGRQANPQQWQGIKTRQEIEDSIITQAKSEQETAQGIASRASPLTAALGGFVGGMGAGFTDPVNIATLPFGVSASTGILRTMGREALLNAGVEAIQEPAIMDWQNKLGNRYGLSDAVGDITLAGAGGAAFAGILHGGAAGLRLAGSKGMEVLDGLSRSEKIPALARDAAQYMSRLAHVDEQVPVAAPTPDDMVGNRQNLSETQDAFKNYREPDLVYRPDTLLDYHDQVKGDIGDLAQLALADKTVNDRVLVGSVAPDAARWLNQHILTARGDDFGPIDVTNFDHAIGAQDIRHAWNRHGLGHETDPQNIPLALEDFKHIPDILANPDQIRVFSSSDKKPAAIRYEQKAPDGSWYIVEHTLTGKKRLAFKTMYKVKSLEEKGSDLLPGEQAKIIRPENGAQPNDSLALNIANNAVLDKAATLRPNAALDSMRSQTGLHEDAVQGDAYQADFARLLKDNPDMNIMDESGDNVSVKDLHDELQGDDAMISAVRTCAIG